MSTVIRFTTGIIGAALLGLGFAPVGYAQKAGMDDADRVVRTIIVSDTAGTSSSVVRPGAPGEPSRAYDATTDRGAPAHTEADITFMQDMILHHAQALEMTALVEERTADEQLRSLALRIERAQADEIAQMVQWLHDRDAEVPALPPIVHESAAGDAIHNSQHSAHHNGSGTTMDHEHADHSNSDHDGHANHAMHDHSDMVGMLSPDQMQQLADAEGERFEQLFLEFMIYHHEGAVIMVEELYQSPGGGQESTVDLFASHVESAQDTEIRRMQRMLTAYE